MVIYDQLKKMGAGLDWDRAVFMMDPVSLDLKFLSDFFKENRARCD